PPLLYWAALHTDLQDLRDNLRPIALLAVGLVLVTTAAVAALAHAVFGLPLAVAVVLGAIVSPPDPVAATAVCGRLGLPRRMVTVLEGEGVLNDAPALARYRAAVPPAAPCASLRRPRARPPSSCCCRTWPGWPPSGCTSRGCWPCWPAAS